MPGLSKAKANKFGDAFLSVIHNYIRRQKIPLPQEKRMEMERGRAQIGTPSPSQLLDQFRRTPGGPTQMPPMQNTVTSEYFQPPSHSYHFNTSLPLSMSLQSAPTSVTPQYNAANIVALPQLTNTAVSALQPTNALRNVLSKRQRIEADPIDDDDECMVVGSKRVGKRQTVLGPTTIVTNKHNGTPIVRQRLSYHA